MPESFFAVAAELDKPLAKLPALALTLGKWIWDPQGTETAHDCWFRKAFDLPPDRKIAKAILQLTADNGYTLFLNGKKIGAGDNWKEPGKYDVTGDLKPGQNVLAIEGHNVDGPFGLVLGLAIALDNGAVVSVPSDDSWRTSLQTRRRLGAARAGRSLLGRRRVRFVRRARGLGGRSPAWNRPTLTPPFTAAACA